MQPLTPKQLTKRLGVTVEVLEQEYAKGDVNFRIWATNRGTMILWQKQGDLYHPLKSKSLYLAEVEGSWGKTSEDTVGESNLNVFQDEV